MLKKGLFISMLLILFFSILGYSVYQSYKYPIISNDIEDFKTEEYSEFRGGSLASKFLPKYEELTDYDSIEFHYFDGTKTLSMYKLGVTFTLDVTYNDNLYSEKKNKIVAKYLYDDVKQCPVDWSCHPISEENNDFTDYTNYFAIIYTNDEKNIIRYIYFYKIEYDEGMYDGASNSFDYSEISW